MIRCERCNWPEDHRAHKPPLGRRFNEESGSVNGGRVTFTSHAFIPPAPVHVQERAQKKHRSWEYDIVPETLDCPDAD